MQVGRWTAEHAREARRRGLDAGVDAFCAAAALVRLGLRDGALAFGAAAGAGGLGAGLLRLHAAAGLPPEDDRLFLSPLCAANLGVPFVTAAEPAGGGAWLVLRGGRVGGRELEVDTTVADLAEPRRVTVAKVKRPKVVLLPEFEPDDGADAEAAELRALEHLQRALAAHFVTPRVVKKADMFAVAVPGDGTGPVGAEEDPWVYFQVTGLSPPAEGPVCVAKGTTDLVLAGAVNAALPPRVGPGLSPNVAALVDLLAPCFHSGRRFRCAVLAHGEDERENQARVEEAAGLLGVHLVPVNCLEISTSNDMGAGLDAAVQKAEQFAPAILLLKRFHALGKDAGQAQGDNRAFLHQLEDVLRASCHQTAMLVVASTTRKSDVAGEVCAHFTHTVEIAPPGAAERLALLRGSAALAGAETGGLLNLEKVAQDTQGMSLVEVQFFLADLGALAAEAGEGAASLGPADVEQAFNRMRERSALDLGAPKIPNVKWDDVGGLQDVKEAILDTIELPLKHRELFTNSLRTRSGVLLYGPPGTGKTLLAKAVATECKLNFLSVKGPELINMYVGESEKNVRDIFQKARRAAPCVIFFDELDALAPARGISGDSGGVMDRVVSQFLAELDGVQNINGGNFDVFIIGATNRPDLIDSSLLRPGRFDCMLYVGIASDPANRLHVLRALTRKFLLEPGLDLLEVASNCPGHLTGADMYALASSAWMNAAKRVIRTHTKLKERGLSVENYDFTVEVTAADFEAAIAGLTPSLSKAELARYEQPFAALQAA